MTPPKAFSFPNRTLQGINQARAKAAADPVVADIFACPPLAADAPNAASGPTLASANNVADAPDVATSRVALVGVDGLPPSPGFAEAGGLPPLAPSDGFADTGGEYYDSFPLSPGFAEAEAQGSGAQSSDAPATFTPVFDHKFDKRGRPYLVDASGTRVLNSNRPPYITGARWANMKPHEKQLEIEKYKKVTITSRPSVIAEPLPRRKARRS